MDQGHQSRFQTPLSYKYLHGGRLAALGAMPLLVLLVAWRFLARFTCSDDSIDCDWAIVMLVLALLVGLGLCGVAVSFNLPEHRFYATDKGVCLDGLTHKVRVHRLGLDTPWHPHQQIAFTCLTMIIWAYFATVLPAIDMDNTTDLIMMFIWCALLLANAAMTVYISAYDPSDGVSLDRASPDPSGVSAAEAVPFDSVCFICQQVYSSHEGKYRYHCRRCNKCTTRFDHHCTFLNQCIAGNNYKLFFSLVSIMLVWISYTAAYSVYLILEARDDSSHVARHVQSTWGKPLWTTVLCLLGFLCVCGTLLLLMLWLIHVRFVLANWSDPNDFAGTFNYEYDDEEMRRVLKDHLRQAFFPPTAIAISSWKHNMTISRDRRVTFVGSLMGSNIQDHRPTLRSQGTGAINQLSRRTSTTISAYRPSAIPERRMTEVYGSSTTPNLSVNPVRRATTSTLDSSSTSSFRSSPPFTTPSDGSTIQAQEEMNCVQIV